MIWLRIVSIWGMVLFSSAPAVVPAMSSGPQVLRMTKEELRPLLGHPEVVILDVRVGEEWNRSPWKIPGAVREDPLQGGSWMDKYPRDKTYIFY